MTAHDLTGLKCPLPVLHARRLLRAITPPATAVFLVDDPKAPADFANFCEITGWQLVADEPAESATENQARRITLRLEK